MKIKLDVANRVVDPAKIETGAWLHLHMPNDTSALVYADSDGKYPARIKVRSARNKAYQDAQYAFQAAASSNRKAKSKAVLDIVRDALEIDRPRNFSLLVMAVENLDSSKLGETIVPSEEDLIAVAKLPEYQWMVDQVMNFAFNDGNFGGEETPQGNAAGGDKEPS